MKEKDLSEILKDADEEMINRISENFPEDDENRKQRIFEKTAEKYAQKISSGVNSADDISADIISKKPGRMLLKYISAAAAFVLVFAGTAAGIILNNSGSSENTVYDSVQTTYTKFSTDSAVTVQTSCGTALKTETINTAAEITAAVSEISPAAVISMSSDNVSVQDTHTGAKSVPAENESPETQNTELSVNQENESADETSLLTETTPAVTTVTEKSELAEEQSVWYWPVSGFTYLSSDFWDERNHGAIDIVQSESEAMEGKYIYEEPVAAAFSGVVAAVSNTCTHNKDGYYGEDGEWKGSQPFCRCGGGYGNYVLIQGSDGVYSSCYAHLNEVTTEQGKFVNAGDIIGYVGTSGMSIGPHLHFEVRKNGVKTDPLSYLYIDLETKESVILQQFSETETEETE